MVGNYDNTTTCCVRKSFSFLSEGIQRQSLMRKIRRLTIRLHFRVTSFLPRKLSRSRPVETSTASARTFQQMSDSWRSRHLVSQHERFVRGTTVKNGLSQSPLPTEQRRALCRATVSHLGCSLEIRHDHPDDNKQQNQPYQDQFHCFTDKN